MKKLTTLLMSLMMIVSLTACGNSGAPSSSAPKSSAPESTPSSEPESEASQKEDAQTGKTLVVYYSATGNTEAAANCGGNRR